MSVGIDYETAGFAVETLRRWWLGEGRLTYCGAGRLLICADGGGSDDYRSRLWKVELARFARGTGLELTVCHLPPGTSKGNKIEHRLFAHIIMNWRGRPLTSHEAVIELIGATTTRQGLRHSYFSTEPTHRCRVAAFPHVESVNTLCGNCGQNL